MPAETAENIHIPAWVVQDQNNGQQRASRAATDLQVQALVPQVLDYIPELEGKVYRLSKALGLVNHGTVWNWLAGRSRPSAFFTMKLLDLVLITANKDREELLTLRKENQELRKKVKRGS